MIEINGETRVIVDIPSPARKAFNTYIYALAETVGQWSQKRLSFWSDWADTAFAHLSASIFGKPWRQLSRLISVNFDARLICLRSCIFFIQLARGQVIGVSVEVNCQYSPIRGYTRSWHTGMRCSISRSFSPSPHPIFRTFFSIRFLQYLGPRNRLPENWKTWRQNWVVLSSENISLVSPGRKRRTIA